MMMDHMQAVPLSQISSAELPRLNQDRNLTWQGGKCSTWDEEEAFLAAPLLRSSHVWKPLAGGFRVTS